MNALSEYWSENTSNNLRGAIALAEIERKLGYVGFIHHFKNFIIRGTDEYYQKARTSYEETSNALLSLKSLTKDSQDLKAIETIENTLRDYHHKLLLARKTGYTLSVKELDRIVKVDDAKAEKALNQLRKNLLPRLEEQQTQTEENVNSLNKGTLLIGLLLVPFFIFSSVLAIYLIRQLSSTSAELSTILNMSPDGILYINSCGEILNANNAAIQLFGYQDHELQNMPIENLVQSHFREKHKKLRTQFSKQEQSRQMGSKSLKISGVRKDGSLVDLRIAISAKNIQGEMRSVCVIKDVSQLLKLEDAAEKDHLTSLNNRRYFDEILDIELQRSTRERHPLPLLMIDLDHFKSLNDCHGHAEGDGALKKVADFLKQHTRPYDHLARWGGDEFVLLCPNLSDSDAMKQAERIRSEFEALPLPRNTKLTLSIGLTTIASGKTRSPKELLKEADEAVYSAKENGKNLVKHYNSLANE